MGQYYQENAVYQEIAKRGGGSFAWACGNAWNLLYGDSDSVPRVLAVVRGASSYSGDATAVSRTSHAAQAATCLSHAAGIPAVTVVFEDRADEIDTVQFSVGQGAPEMIGLAQLRTRFADLGVPVSTGGTNKAINDKASSAFHQWQRRSLGAITVSDLDLFRLNMSLGTANEIVELKRSFYPLKEWTPYPQDFSNFNLISHLAGIARVRFTIAYNQRNKAPFHDDASRLKVYAYSTCAGPEEIAIMDFDRFYRGEY